MELKSGYKLTELGVIPEEWAVTSFSSSIKIIDGDSGENYPNGKDFNKDGYCLFLNAGNVTKSGFKFDECYFITQEKDQQLNKGKLVIGDIVVTTRGTVGNFCFFDENVPFNHIRINSGMVILRNQCKDLDTKFLYKIIQSYQIEKQINQQVFGSAQPQLTVRDINKFLSIVPSMREQQAIATALSDIDSLIECILKIITKKRDIKQATMQQLLTGKTRLPGFSGKWIEKKLGDTAVLKARIGWQGLTTAEYLSIGEYYLVTGTEFCNGYIDWRSCHFVEEARYKQDKYIQLKIHDVLVTKDGTIGKVALVSELPLPATLNSGVFVIRPIENAFYPEFFYYLLCSRVFTNFLDQLSAGSTINHLYQKDFVGFKYKVPESIAEQSAIAQVLSDMDNEIAALEKRLEKTRMLKQGMMQELLTGRIRLV